MKHWVGTSGFSYKEWKGSFYPEKIKNADMLTYYGERLNAVEINNTFYRMPRRSVLEDWCTQVPDDFQFVLKASRKITHFKKLADVGDELGYLLDVITALGDRLGPMLIQTPPYLKKDVPLLEDFVAQLPEGFRGAFEFRSSSWSDDEVYSVLESRALAFVTSDMGGDKPKPPVVRTAPYGYARLRREEYDDASLGDWAKEFADQEWDDLFVFFKHEDEGTGPALAKRWVDLVS